MSYLEEVKNQMLRNQQSQKEENYRNMFIPSRGNTKLNQKIEGGRLRGMKFHKGFVNKVIKPVGEVVSAVGIPVAKAVASVVAPGAIPAITAFDAVKKGIEATQSPRGGGFDSGIISSEVERYRADHGLGDYRGGSFDPQGNRIPSSNKGRLGGRKDADHRKDKPKNPNEKNPNDKKPKGGSLMYIMP